MTATDIDTERYYIVERRIADISVLPFGFRTEHEAELAIRDFSKKRQAGMSVVRGSHVGEVKEDWIGKRVT